MLGTDFYHGLIKKYIVIFGALFNSIMISRYDKNGNEIEKMKVPLAYSPKDKLLARVVQDPEIQKQTAISLPRMGFEMTNMVYNRDRKLNRIGKIVSRGDDANHMKMVYQPVAYDFSFSLYIMVKNSEDATKIVEQILPYFTPDFTVFAELIPEMNLSMDIPIVHTGVTITDVYQGPLTERQALIYQIDFILNGYLYGPVINKPIIKFVKTFSHIGSPGETEEVMERVAIYPGLTANGEPTSNSAESIAPSLIQYDDNYGFIEVHDMRVMPANTFPFDRTDLE